MRLSVGQGGSGSGPLHRLPKSGTNNNQPCSRYVKITPLIGQPIYYLVEAKSKTKELLSQVYSYFRGLGMLDTELFGLAVLLEGEYVLADPEYKLSKYAPKSWKSSSSNGLDSSGKPLLEFFFRVQFYVESPLLLRDDLSAEHYFTQVQNNVVERGILHPNTSHQALYVLAGLALQAIHGDNSQPHFYSQPHQYLPPQAVMTCGEDRLISLLSTLHRANHGMSQAQARVQYIREASSLDTSPIPYNTHVYKLRTKEEPLPGSVLLAISARGLQLFQENSSKALSGTFLWNDIGKLCFVKKKFEIRGVEERTDEKHCYYTSSYNKSKHLLSLCKETHQHSMAIAPRLAHVIPREITEKKQSRDWCIELGKYQKSSRYSGNGEQRISVISSTSSTTTSGIVSDRVHSLDESEDDLELEIIINCPPAASVESLALAHLKDNSDSSPTTVPPHAQNGDVGGPTGGDKASPSMMTPATTDGSQCSSSASTVVVHQQPTTETTVDTVNLLRCESVTSSLELGYSHTAEHSTVSESNCCELDCSVRSAQASSGVYTLDTTTDNGDAQTAIDTVASSSGIGLESNGQRSRSGSIVSHSGSFHGDGSDPSEAGQGNPLSAEELSNLIVNPGSPRPRRGVYPTRATVSSTLDSVSDYVTLPPPPLPPPQLVVLPHLSSTYPLHTLPSAEEATARFISTKPQINVLTARSTRLPSAPAFATTSPRGVKINRMIPLVSPNNYLDFRSSSYLRRQPPPPPPPRPNVATVYTSQVTNSQIEQFKRQLYSDVDYVIYPMKDPSISKQEYFESKLYRYTPPPPYPNLIYRSTPNVAIAASSYMHKFASNQNLSEYYLSGSPLYSAAASYSSSSTHSLRYDHLLPPAPAPFHRTLSHDNILDSDRPFTTVRRPPPPAPPLDLPDALDLLLDGVASTSSKSPSSSQQNELLAAATSARLGLDISSLREKSRNLDLPLISALCNDKSLLKQTKAFVVPQHPGSHSDKASQTPSPHAKAASLDRKSLLLNLLSSGSSASPKLKYPVSGMSTNQLVKANRKPTSRHKHPEPASAKIARTQSASASYKDSKH